MSSDEFEEKAYERLNDLLKTPYSGEMWDALLGAVASEIAELDKASSDVEAAQFVTTAQDGQLDKIGEVFGLERRRGENDDVFRSRIQVALRSSTTSATVEEIREIIISLLDPQNPDDVIIDEPYNLEQLHINLDLPLEELDQSDISDADFISVIETIVAAGVSVGILLEYENQSSLVFSSEASADGDRISVFSSHDGRWGVDTFNAAEMEEFNASSVLAMSSVGKIDDGVEAESTLALGDFVSVSFHTPGVFYTSDGEGWNQDVFNVDSFVEEYEEQSTMLLTARGQVEDEIEGSPSIFVLSDKHKVEADEVSGMYWDEGRWGVDVITNS